MGLSNSGEGGYSERIDGRLEYVEFSRGLAIIGIVLFHYLRRLDLTPLLSTSIEIGGSAVHLFFFLSGFSLALSYRSDHRSFYIRRFLGVLLPYYLLVSMVFLTTLVLPIYPTDGWFAYLSHIFLFKMFDNELIGTYGGHLWFVSSIVEFYLVFPLLFVCLKKKGAWTFMTAGICVSAAYWVALYRYGLYSDYVYKDFFLQFLWEFAMGMVCADLLRRQGFKFWEVKPKIAFAVFVASAIALFLLHVKTGTLGRAFNDVPLSLIFISLSIMAYHLVRDRLPIALGIVLWIGQISYSLYLIHMLCFALVMHFAKVQSPRGIEIVAAAAVALVCAPLFHIVMDRLQRRLRNNLRPTEGFRLTHNL